MANSSKHCCWTSMKFILILSLYLPALLLHCDAGRSRQAVIRGSRTSFHKQKKELKTMRHYDEMSPPELSSNTAPYGIGSPFSLPPFDSPAPISMPQGQITAPYCIYPPPTPTNPSPSFPSPSAPSLYIPPIFPILSPPPGPSGSSPTPLGPSSNPNPPQIVPSPPSYVPGQSPTPPTHAPTNPSPSFPSPPAPSLYVPPIFPILSPPPGPSGSSPTPSGPSSNPNPPQIVPSPPSYVPGLSPTPPTHAPTPSGNPPSFEPSPPSYTPTPGGTGGSGGGTPGGGIVPNPPVFVPSPPVFQPPVIFPPVFVPSPPVFQPPVIFPPPAVPPPPRHHGESLTLWCVAKPSVPDPIIQEAMNYACGSGAECDSIQPNGRCFQPNTLVAHASYAFNSYWQMTKVAGGTCEFGGTAILVTVDPSYDGCHFIIT